MTIVSFIWTFCCLVSFAGRPGNTVDRLPVIVFIHGESFDWGSSHLYDGSVLSSYANVVVVTLNFRLGVLGTSQFATFLFFSSCYFRNIVHVLWRNPICSFFRGERGESQVCRNCWRGSKEIAIEHHWMDIQLNRSGLFKLFKCIAYSFWFLYKDKWNRQPRDCVCRNPWFESLRNPEAKGISLSWT